MRFSNLRYPALSHDILLIPSEFSLILVRRSLATIRRDLLPRASATLPRKQVNARRERRTCPS